MASRLLTNKDGDTYVIPSASDVLHNPTDDTAYRVTTGGSIIALTQSAPLSAHTHAPPSRTLLHIHHIPPTPVPPLADDVDRLRVIGSILPKAAKARAKLPTDEEGFGTSGLS